MCGILGFNGSKPAFPTLRNGAFQLHHRGQRFSGMATSEGGKIYPEVKPGFIKQNFLSTDGERFKGEMGITQVSAKEEQPVWIEDEFAVAFSGKFTNQAELEERYGVLPFPSSKAPATEVLARIILKARKEGKDFVEGIRRINEEVRGGWILEILDPQKGVYAARDPYGFRPGVFGKSVDGCAVASESVAFRKIGMELVRDVKPGEIALLERNAYFRIIDQLEQPQPLGRPAFCLFEYIYNARAASVIEGVLVKKAQLNMGALQAEDGDIEADLVIGIPLSGILHGLGYSRQSGIQFGWTYDYNRYSDRSYYPLEQEARDETAEDKMVEIEDEEIKGKRIVVVDDSLVRSTQIRKLIFRLLELGAKEVYLVTGAPPLVAPCPYYISTRSFEELAAANHDISEIARMIGAKIFKPNTVEKCKRAVIEAQSEERKAKNPLKPEYFCDYCFVGGIPPVR